MFYRFSVPPAGLEANVFAGIWCQGICHYCTHFATKHILRVEPIEKDSCSGLPAHGLSTEEQATSCSAVDLISQVHG